MIKKIALSIACLLTAGIAFSQSVFSNKDKVANEGYDVVNYFKSYTAQRGSKEFSTEYNGAFHYFVSAENLNVFKESPQKYLPQFDGYCAFAVSELNQKVPVDPNTFRIDDGKLYLFFNDYWEGKPFNTIVPWVNNEKEMEAKANKNWTTLKGK